MPVYEYRCSSCGTTIESVRPVGGAFKTVRCTCCGKRATRVYSTPAIHFKGSGFYQTDYKRKKEHGAKEEKPPQEVKKDADKKPATDNVVDIKPYRERRKAETR